MGKSVIREISLRFHAQETHPVSAKLFLISFTSSLITNIEQGIMNVEGGQENLIIRYSLSHG